ncbi:hypothetical protein Acr_08g0014050 [Actinidia rufa]|uniref:Uncharacterized protein n=1 Tax=Actinidia rufa TaxID=165716 RepID=A0A7J0F440_9ERIC|nr:hypothetical protein Acr_08g0014050 [Actinidia rufa]
MKTRVLAAEVPVEKEVDTSELKVGSKDIGSYGVEATPETIMIQKIQIDIEGQRPHDYHTDQLQDIQPEPSAMGLSDVISVNTSAAAEMENRARELVKEELPTNIETTFFSVDDLSVSEADQTMDDLGTGNSEAENTTYFVHDSSEVGPDASHLRITAPARSDLQNRQGEDSEEAMKEPKPNCMNIVLAESVDAVCKGVKSNHDSGAEVSERTAETPPSFSSRVRFYHEKIVYRVADDSHCRDGGLGPSGVSTENLLMGSQSKKLAKPPIEVPANESDEDGSIYRESVDDEGEGDDDDSTYNQSDDYEST